MKTITCIIILQVLVGSLSAQNVGINVSNPTRAKFEVSGVAGSGNTVAVFGSDGAGISFQRYWPTIGFNQYRDDPVGQGKYMSSTYAAIQYFDIGGGSFAIDLFPAGTAGQRTPGGTRALTVANNGNTSIRGASLDATLTVARGDGVDGTAVFTGPGHNSHINYSSNEDTYIRAGLDGGTVYINKIPIGPVLIGTTASRISINNPGVIPSYTIDIWAPSGQKAFTFVDNYNYRWAMQPSFINTLNNGTGVVLDYYYNNVGRSRFQFWDGNFIPLSDGRMKTDVQRMAPILDKVKQLKPVQYEMIRNNPEHKKSLGMVAQDVQPLFPQLVHTFNDHYEKQPINGALVMDYSGFGVLAVKALQEQQKQIKDLEKQLTGLLDELKALAENQ